MTTLNARANQAYHALVEESGEDWHGFDHQRDAFEEGWATGYKTAEVDMNVDLEAAAPLLGPRPQVGVVHVQHADAEEYARIFNLGFAEAAEQYADGSRPLLDREALREALDTCTCSSRPGPDGQMLLQPRPPCPRDGDTHARVDAVMELARPMPTREQIEEVIGDELDGEGVQPYPSLVAKLARRVTDLLNGAES